MFSLLCDPTLAAATAATPVVFPSVASPCFASADTPETAWLDDDGPSPAPPPHPKRKRDESTSLNKEGRSGEGRHEKRKKRKAAKRRMFAVKRSLGKFLRGDVSAVMRPAIMELVDNVSQFSIRSRIPTKENG